VGIDEQPAHITGEVIRDQRCAGHADVPLASGTTARMLVHFSTQLLIREP